MSKLAGTFAVAAALCAASFAVHAEEDAEGAKDHPMVERFPGSVIEESVVREFEEFALPLADEDDNIAIKTRHVEGRFTYLRYSLPQTASCTQVIRNYEKAFQRAGLQTRRGQNPRLFGEGPQWQRGKWVSADGKPNGTKGDVYVLYACAGDGGDIGKLVVVEAGEMEQKVGLDVSAMQAEIEKSGHVALHGIQFETGKATITADSATTLRQIA